MNVKSKVNLKLNAEKNAEMKMNMGLEMGIRCCRFASYTDGQIKPAGAKDHRSGMFPKIFHAEWKVCHSRSDS
jgi:hypothetical protein